jgi:NADH dehydrogenase (ubiquinone) 1 beta subcomplex subunit 9
MSTPRPDDAASNAADTGTRSLYRRSLKLALDWSVHRELWRGQAVYIRSLFENNRHVSDPRLQRVRHTLLFFTKEGISSSERKRLT